MGPDNQDTWFDVYSHEKSRLIPHLYQTFECHPESLVDPNFTQTFESASLDPPFRSLNVWVSIYRHVDSNF